MKLIQDWLKGGQNYAVGVRLYMRFGRDKQLQRLFTTEGVSDFKKKRLASALQEIAQAADAKPVSPATTQVVAIASTTTQNTFLKQWPEPPEGDPVKLLWDEARVLLKEIAELHGKLDALPSDELRRAVAFSLLRKDEELDAVYSRRDFYLKYKKMPEEQLPFTPITDPHLLANRIANLKRYVRREKSAITADENNLDAKQRLAVFEAELTYYKKKTWHA